MKTKEKGITLIALVITIIVLIMLAGISIAELTGNGLFARAQQAKEKAKIAQYTEAIKLARTETNIEKITNNTQDIDILVEMQEILEKQDLFKKANFSFDSVKSTLTITTKEKYVFEVTNNGQKYLGKLDEINTMPKEITKTDLGFKPNTSGWTNDKVIVEIIINNEEYKKYKVQYSFDVTNDNSWIDYTDEGIEVTENKVIYARLTDGKNSTNYIQENVVNIDTVAPTIGSATGTTETGNTGTITVTSVTDTGGSGLKGYYISTSSTTPTETSVTWISSTASSFTKTVSSNGTYYVWVIDNAGNVSESKSCTVSGIVEKITGVDIDDTFVMAVGKQIAGGAIFTGGSSYKSISFNISDSSIAKIVTTVGGNFFVLEGVSTGTTTFTCTVTNYDGTVVTCTKTVTVNCTSLASIVTVGDYVAYDTTSNYSYTSPAGTGSSHGAVGSMGGGRRTISNIYIK